MAKSGRLELGDDILQTL